MTDDERKELIQNIVSMCHNDQLNGLVIISVLKDGNVMFYAAGSDNNVLADSASYAAQYLYEESEKEVANIVPPSSSLH